MIYRTQACSVKARPNRRYIEKVKPPGNYNTIRRLATFCESVENEDDCIDYLLGVSKYEAQNSWNDERNREYEQTVKFSETEFEVKNI